MQIEAFPADAVCLATGGPGLVYGRSTNSTINTGSANGRTYMDGALYGNAEFIQGHPTAIPGEDKHRLMSESAPGEGGRIWVPKQKGDKRPPKNNLVKDSPRQQMTNIPGLYATGECDYAYHGANRLGANSLLSCIYAGMIGGPAMIAYAKNAAPKKGDVPSALLGGAKQQWVER